jgi:6-phosphofructokinase 1
MKTLLVVSGGDSPGVNAALFQYTRLARSQGDEVIGTAGSFAGLLAGHLVDLQTDILAGVAALGGSYLPSSRDPVLKDPANRKKLLEMLAANQVDNILLLGGDGTLRHIPPILAEMGVVCATLPTTIDNDVPGTEDTIGFDSACNFAHHTIDNLLATARALPGRIFSVESLGGNTGLLALDIAYAAGAHAVLVPEYGYNDAWLVERLKQAVQHDHYALLVLSEGVVASRTLVSDMKARFGLQIRDTRLGHGQRGGSPSHHDRVLASRMARVAYDALRTGAKAGTVVVKHGQLDFYPDFLRDMPTRLPDQNLYNRVNGL